MRISDLPGNWRERLQPASFRGVQFHVEVDTRAGGRRTITHQYPKRNDPYSEDMGRSARRFLVKGYLIGSDYLDARDRLIQALEEDGPGTLRLPLPFAGEDVEVMVDGDYNLVTTRDRGGYCEIDMPFVEAGVAAFSVPEVNTPSRVEDSSLRLEDQSVNSLNEATA